VLRQPAVSAPIVGPTKVHHLSDAVAALDVHLSDDEVTQLEEHYVPHIPRSFQ
jgi:aryl-alcohol dehydrogenase-like predicted oxidoreductase